MPWPIAGKRRSKTDQYTELILKVFTDAAFDLDLDHIKPTEEDINLVCRLLYIFPRQRH